MPLTDVAAAIDTLAGTVKVRRYPDTYTAGMYDPDTGRWEPNRPWNADATETSIQAVVLSKGGPFRGTMHINDVPEGVYADAEWQIWTRYSLRLDDDSNGTKGDEILWNGEWHRLLWLWPRREGGFTKALMGAIRDRGRT